MLKTFYIIKSLFDFQFIADKIVNPLIFNCLHLRQFTSLHRQKFCLYFTRKLLSFVVQSWVQMLIMKFKKKDDFCKTLCV